MDRNFPYDIVTLLEAVESRPCIWDSSQELHKDLAARKNAWNDICRILEPEFDRDEKKQEEIFNKIRSKWTHLRDSFKRSLKTKPRTVGQYRAKRKYVYADSMQFLLKNMATDETESSVASMTDEEYDLEKSEEPIASTSHEINFTKRIKIDPGDDEMLTDTLYSNSPRRTDMKIDEDYAFLLSLLPTLKKIPDDDKIDFRIEVMQLVNRYTKQRFKILP